MGLKKLCSLIVEEKKDISIFLKESGYSDDIIKDVMKELHE